jgi:N-acetylglucosaminyl-diphospho-decaprenol L-rhamnosyltransferase
MPGTRFSDFHNETTHPDTAQHRRWIATRLLANGHRCWLCRRASPSSVLHRTWYAVSVKGALPPTVDVVVVTRDTREITLGCLESVLEAGGEGASVRCTVVDNASSDGTAEAIQERFPRVRLIRSERNLGYGSACNQGLRDGDGEYVLILNSDIVARPGAIARLAGYLAASPGHAAAGGRLVNPGTDDVQVGHNVRAFPRLAPQVAQMLGLERRWPSNPLSRRYLMLDLDYTRTQDVDQPAGSCLCCRRADFETVGGFDEGFFYWYEDVDLVRRLRDRGRIAYVSDAVFEHLGGATFAQWKRPDQILSWYPSLFRYFSKHRPRLEQLALRVTAATLAGIRGIAYLAFDRDRARACAHVVRLALVGERGNAERVAISARSNR